ncbi:hypothetical protein C8R46DRAFT_1092121 [Mycena filopes]|nr:hypothetical protein C8R46DRAFT_1092121 [Mycena filopes]
MHSDDTAHDATRYPIESRIPIDILELIFEAGARSAQRQSSTFPKPIEIVVSHVNRRWREIAVNLAMLWSFIRASPFEPLDKLETYFERSKNHVLRVCLFAYKAYWSPDILEWLRPHLHRVEQFHLVTDFIHSAPTVCEHFTPFDMPALETFLFTPLDFAAFEAPPPPPLLPFADGAPHLTSIRLNGPTLGLIQPPFAGITQLCLSERFTINFRSICEILRSCGRLVRFSFAGHTQRPHRRLATPAEVFPFTLPELRYLQLSNGGNADVILSAMTAPKLCALRLSNFDDGDLAYFLQQSEPGSAAKFPVLESLSLLDDTFSLAEYHDIARVFPAIRAFSCLNSSYTDEVLEFLVPLPTSSGAPHMPWPNLGALAFSQAQFHEKHQAMLCSLVAARVALRAPIGSLFLGHANRLLLDTDRLEWLRERLHVVEEGAEMPEDEQMRELAEFSSDDVW